MRKSLVGITGIYQSSPDVPSIIAANAGDLGPNDGVSSPANRTLHVRYRKEECLKQKRKKRKRLKTVKFEQAIDKTTELQ